MLQKLNNYQKTPLGEFFDVYYIKARYYEPSTGRFLSEDPKWNTNLFIYCENNPINNIDVNGEFLETAADLLSLGVSAYEYKNNPTLKNGLMLGWDIVSLAIPFLPGSYAYKAVNLAGDAGKYVKTAKVSRSVTKTSTKLLNQFNSAESLIDGATNLTKVKAGIQGFVKGDGPSIFKAITNNGKKQVNGTILMQDGTIIFNHFSTKTGVYTININKAGQIYKIRIVQ